MKVREEISSLRTRRALHAIVERLERCCDRLGMRIVHFSVQSEHIHLAAEAEDRRSLSRAVRGLAVRIAPALGG